MLCEGIAAVAVVRGGAGGEIRGEALGERDEARTGAGRAVSCMGMGRLRVGARGRARSPAARGGSGGHDLHVDGTPLVTMS